MRRLVLVLVVSCFALSVAGPTAGIAASSSVVTVPDVSPRPYALEDVAVPRPVGNVVASPDHVWAIGRTDPLDRPPKARHLDPTLKTVTAQIPVPEQGASAAALDGNTFWAQLTDANGSSVLARYDLASGQQLAAVQMDGVSDSLDVGHGSVWATGTVSPVLERIDSATNRVVAKIPVDTKRLLRQSVTTRHLEAAVTTSAVWVLTSTHRLFEIDPATNHTTDRSALLKRVGKPAVGLGATGQFLLVSNGDRIDIIDTTTRKVTGTVQAPAGGIFYTTNYVGRPTGIATADNNKFWVILTDKSRLPTGILPPVAPPGGPLPARIVQVDARGPSVTAIINAPFPPDMSAVGDDLWTSVDDGPRLVHATPAPTP
jgi:hypothetical protein